MLITRKDTGNIHFFPLPSFSYNHTFLRYAEMIAEELQKLKAEFDKLTSL